MIYSLPPTLLTANDLGWASMRTARHGPLFCLSAIPQVLRVGGLCFHIWRAVQRFSLHEEVLWCSLGHIDMLVDRSHAVEGLYWRDFVHTQRTDTSVETQRYNMKHGLIVGLLARSLAGATSTSLERGQRTTSGWTCLYSSLGGHGERRRRRRRSSSRWRVNAPWARAVRRYVTAQCPPVAFRVGLRSGPEERRRCSLEEHIGCKVA
mmetsp:Transcript_14343/g.33709  ORF Transcript_14343/g.33709 Transcript_14343/m.33709 type:complete len:207 (+) Transcript_14343:701-1321(+)